jgi:hypothetical protein
MGVLSDCGLGETAVGPAATSGKTLDKFGSKGKL